VAPDGENSGTPYARGAVADHSSSSKQYSNIRSNHVIKLQFFQVNHIFLARIDQQVEIFHSSSSKQYSNIRSNHVIKLHFS